MPQLFVNSKGPGVFPRPLSLFTRIGYQSDFPCPCAILLSIEGGDGIDLKYVYHIDAGRSSRHRQHESVEIILVENVANAD